MFFKSFRFLTKLRDERGDERRLLIFEKYESVLRAEEHFTIVREKSILVEYF